MAIFSRSKKKAQPVSVAPDAARAHAVDDATEERIREIGRELLDVARGERSGLLSAKFYSDKLMDWSMKDHAFKVQLFRFVDAFPMLRTPDAVFDHLTDYLTQPGVKVPPGLDLGLKAGGMAKGLATSTISKQIKSMATKFIAGTDAASALGSLEKSWKAGMAFSVDMLGEACVSTAEAEMYRERYMDLVTNLPETAGSWKANEVAESDHLGRIPRTNVSIKISSLSALCDPIDTEGAIADLMTRLIPIIEAARDNNVFVNFDMEQHELKDLTIELFKRCCDQVPDFHAGIALQAYLRSAEADARTIADWALAKGRIVTVRLVKGAYWDYEVIHAEEQGWPCPVWTVKRDSDACFERVTDILLDACPRTNEDGGVKLALGSHNVRSIAYAAAGLERRGLPQAAMELQMLHGMADELKRAAIAKGWRLREYVPVGELIPGMAYLVRRLLENTSNESWLKAGFLDNADPEVLLASPHRAAPDAAANGSAEDIGEGVGERDLSETDPERHKLSPTVKGIGGRHDGRPFFTEPVRDFSHKSVRDTFDGAVQRAQVPPVANDTTLDAASAMVAKASESAGMWRDADPLVRARVLTRAAESMRARRDELAGVMVKEAGKPWREADADVCEAIDFCEYYARYAVGLFQRERLGNFIGELDELWHQARGVCVVISPWNFPLAISCGMVTAALVTGNPVILKPAEQTPGIAKLLADILDDALEQEAGIAPGSGVFSFCPGMGETVGASLVRDPRISMIAFTGSKAVGLDIIEAAGATSEAQRDVKRVVCEMGGKNAVIVDTSADLDEAVLGVRYSAFGFQGQKCSACSRCIVVDPEGPDGPAMKHFTQRLVESVRSLVIGDPTHSGTDVGPVIDGAAKAGIMGMIETARSEGCTEILAMQIPDGLEVSTGRDYVAPHVFSGVTPEHTIAQQEIFGPVLAIMHAHSFEEALTIANATAYKLTGGVFSRKPANLERAKREYRVGNLYLNRGCTGALVGRMPFGGFGMSGIGSKAGGPAYLMQFVEPRACCENTMRRGFAPEL